MFVLLLLLVLLHSDIQNFCKTTSGLSLLKTHAVRSEQRELYMAIDFHLNGHCSITDRNVACNEVAASPPLPPTLYLFIW
jgi:hypothetical protein